MGCPCVTVSMSRYEPCPLRPLLVAIHCAHRYSLQLDTLAPFGSHRVFLLLSTLYFVSKTTFFWVSNAKFCKFNYTTHIHCCLWISTAGTGGGDAKAICPSKTVSFFGPLLAVFFLELSSSHRWCSLLLTALAGHSSLVQTFIVVQIFFSIHTRNMSSKWWKAGRKASAGDLICAMQAIFTF